MPNKNKYINCSIVKLSELTTIYYFIIATGKGMGMLYSFPHLSSHLAECFYRYGVRGIPKGVAATSFPLCKTKMASPLSLVPNFPEIR